MNAVEGGIGGRKLTLLTKDDGYEAARVKANTDELLETGNLFALTTTADTPGNLAVYDKVNEECVPSLIVGSGHPAWGDPRDHPWIMSSFLSYSTEANIWGKYILDTLGKGASVAALVMNNDFGLSMRSNFETFAKANGLSLRAEVHDPAAPNVTNELTTLASSNADVAILMTTSSYCTQAFTAIAQSTWKPKVKLVSQTCAGIATFFKPAGETGRDWVLAGGNKELTDKAFANDPFVQTARATMEKAGLDPANAQHGNGWWYAWGTAEVLRNAAKLPGGLTRTNTLLAMRSLDTHHPLMYDGIKFAQNGLKDSFTAEGAQLTRYTIEPGQEVGAHVPFGPPIDVNATTRNCSWDGKACREY
ncbi:MAG: ABC transporter substrate-binding protein [Acidimicrobiales bacterium]